MMHISKKKKKKKSATEDVFGTGCKENYYINRALLQLLLILQHGLLHFSDPTPFPSGHHLGPCIQAQLQSPDSCFGGPPVTCLVMRGDGQEPQPGILASLTTTPVSPASSVAQLSVPIWPLSVPPTPPPGPQPQLFRCNPLHSVAAAKASSQLVAIV